MITETAPMDSLIQRFGRVNRRRSQETIGLYKHVYVIPPPHTKKEARPYESNELLITYNILPNGELLEEIKIQEMIDTVFPKVNTRIIDNDTIFNDGRFYLKKLTHQPKSVLMELLDISSVSCITQKDVVKYKKTENIERINQEIPVSYQTIAFRGLDQLNIGNKPFIIPDNAYDTSIGLLNEKLDPVNYTNIYQFI